MRDFSRSDDCIVGVRVSMTNLTLSLAETNSFTELTIIIRYKICFKLHEAYYGFIFDLFKAPSLLCKVDYENVFHRDYTVERKIFLLRITDTCANKI